MKPLDNGFAVLTAIIWGLSFIAIKYGVEAAPPFLLTALRFTFAAFPFLLFVRPPATPWMPVAAYGVLIGVAQFGLLFLAIRLKMPVGLASLVIQAQVYFTILLAVIFLGERPTRAQILGAALALIGMATIAEARAANASLGPFLITIAAAFCWSSGNIVAKNMGRVDALSLMVWSSLAVPIPMVALSYYLSPDETWAALAHPSLKLIVCVAALAYGATLVGFVLWARLLSRNSAASVAPFALLVPVVGMIASALLFGERYSLQEYIGAFVVMSGLGLNVLAARLRQAG